MSSRRSSTTTRLRLASRRLRPVGFLASLGLELERGSPSPTLEEIAEEFDFHPTNAWRLVFSLLNKGYLHRPPRRHRALEVTERGREFRRQVETEHLSRRRSAAVSPAVALTIVNIRAQLGRLRHAEQAAVLASIGAA